MQVRTILYSIAFWRKLYVNIFLLLICAVALILIVLINKQICDSKMFNRINKLVMVFSLAINLFKYPNCTLRVRQLIFKLKDLCLPAS